MNTELKNSIFEKVNETITNYKSQVDEYIKKLTDLRAVSPTELIPKLDKIIGELGKAKDISLANFDLNKDTKEPTEKFYGDDKHYEYNNLLDKKHSAEIVKLEKKTGLEKAKVMNKIINLKEKRGIIKKSQLKIADEKIKQKLEAYKASKNIDFRKYDKIEEDYNKYLQQFAAQVREENRYEKLGESLKNFEYTDKKSVQDAKSKEKEYKRIGKIVEKLKKKNGKVFKAMDSVIANGVKYNKIEMLKIRAALLRDKLSSKYWEQKVESFDKKGR